MAALSWHLALRIPLCRWAHSAGRYPGAGQVHSCSPHTTPPTCSVLQSNCSPLFVPLRAATMERAPPLLAPAAQVPERAPDDRAAGPQVQWTAQHPGCPAPPHPRAGQAGRRLRSQHLAGKRARSAASGIWCSAAGTVTQRQRQCCGGCCHPTEMSILPALCWCFVGCSLWWLTLSAVCLHEGAQLAQAQRCRRQADAAPWPPMVAAGEEAACGFHPEVCVSGLSHRVPKSRGGRPACPA